jgi:transposase IS4-like protein
MAQTGVVAGGRLTDWISLGVLASRVPAEAVDEAVEATGKKARRRGGKLPPRVTAYLVMALALFAGEDCEEVAARLAGTLADWGGWEESRGQVPTSGGIIQARQRLGPEPAAGLFSRIARPPATEETAGAFLGRWRLMSIDGMAWDIPDTPANGAEFGYPRAGKDGSAGAFPKAQVVTVSECASHAAVLAGIGPYACKSGGERALARGLYPRLERDWLLIAGRGFYDWHDWCTAASTGAALLWRVKSDILLPVLEILPGGSCRTVLVRPRTRGLARQKIIEAARAGEVLDPGMACYARVVGYEVPDRDGDDELIALVTTITDPDEAPAAALAAAYHERREHETGNAQLTTFLRGPGRILRSESPDMVRQEIWGCLLTHHVISALICTAAASAGIDPDRVKFKRTIRAVRRRVADPAFPPDQRQHVLGRLRADITSSQNLNHRRERSYPRVVKRPRHNSYRVKRPGDHGQRHSAPPTIVLVNLPTPRAAA